MDLILRKLKKIIPRRVFQAGQPVYHYFLAFVAALAYGFPSRHLTVVAITGTKGKTSTTELLNAILETAGYKTAIAGTLRFKIGNHTEPNLFKMTMPGRFFIQKFLWQAAHAHCDYAIVEMTSEGAKQFRHAFIDLDALIFLNLAPEHIESHGSYEKYVQAKLKLAHALERSSKSRKVLVANADDKEAARFLAVPISEKYPFTFTEAQPCTIGEDIQMTFRGTDIHSPLRGRFNVYNILAAATYAMTQNISLEDIKKGIESVSEIRGRVQLIHTSPKQDFKVAVDYAHTPDSLTELFKAFPNNRKICVLGSTGGGRDTWKRPAMAKAADEYCESIILTDDDPYDDNPQQIVEDMAKGISEHPYKIILDRRKAIHEAFKQATTNDVVLICGKGTDPYIMGPNGTKTPWSDAEVAREELAKVLAER